MKPATPVVAGLEQFEIVFGKGQPEYDQLPALVGSAPAQNVVARWELTDEDRARIAAGADIFTVQMTFGDFFQPLVAFVGTKALSAEDVEVFRKHWSIGEIIPEENISNMLDTLL